jgi:hypothetical protein
MPARGRAVTLILQPDLAFQNVVEELFRQELCTTQRRHHPAIRPRWQQVSLRLDLRERQVRLPTSLRGKPHLLASRFDKSALELIDLIDQDDRARAHDQLKDAEALDLNVVNDNRDRYVSRCEHVVVSDDDVGLHRTVGEPVATTATAPGACMPSAVSSAVI